MYAVNGFGSGTGLILLDNVNCSGNEMRLEDCQFAPIGEHTIVTTLKILELYACLLVYYTICIHVV